MGMTICEAMVAWWWHEGTTMTWWWLLEIENEVEEEEDKLEWEKKELEVAVVTLQWRGGRRWRNEEKT